MAAANSAIRVAELDFDSIKANLKDFLRSQNEFTDYDFEGSGMSVLLDILAYNTHYQGFYLNMIGNEMFLDTAQLRSSVVSHAKHLDYTPTSKRGARAIVDLTVTPGGAEDNVATTATLSQYTRFISEPIDGVSYVFCNISANTATKVGNSFTFSDLVLQEGEPVTQQYVVSSGSRKFNLPTSDIDTTSLTVTIQESAANTHTTTYTQASDITEVTQNSAVYWLEENTYANSTYAIYFGDGVIGKQPANNNIVIATYLDVNGSAANKANAFVSIESIASEYSSNVIVTPVSSATGGAEKQGIEAIRFMAPRWYTTQNRAVTKNDYETLLLKDYPNIQSISVWPGEENVPPVYGKVFISMKPVTNHIITLAEKEIIKAEILANRSVMTVFPEIVDPNYTYLKIDAKVNYNANKTSLSQNDLRQLVRQAILDYRDEDLNTFNSAESSKGSLRVSKLQRFIDRAHPSILGSSVVIYAQKRIELTLNALGNYSIDYQFPLVKGGSLDNQFYSYPSYSSVDGASVTRSLFIEETPNSFTGLDSIDILNAGSGYTSVPTVTITGDGNGATATAKISGGKITTITVDTRGIDYSVATVSITGGGGSGSGGSASAVLENRRGTLRAFYYKASGEKVIVNPSGRTELGTIDYNTGQIDLIGLTPTDVLDNDYYDDNVITLNVVPKNNLIVPQRNTIFDIDEDDSSSITISMVAES